MVLITSDDKTYPEVKINNFTSVYSIYLKQGVAQGVIAGTLTSTVLTGGCQPFEIT